MRARFPGWYLLYKVKTLLTFGLRMLKHTGWLAVFLRKRKHCERNRAKPQLRPELSYPPFVSYGDVSLQKNNCPGAPEAWGLRAGLRHYRWLLYKGCYLTQALRQLDSLATVQPCHVTGDNRPQFKNFARRLQREVNYVVTVGIFGNHKKFFL